MNIRKRSFELDLLRGVGIILMIFFHFGYDLAHFGYASYNTTIDGEWLLFRGLVLSIFLLAVGMSAYLAYSKELLWKKLLKRLMKLLAVALMISAGSYFIFPDYWIYFGVIHFIVLASLAAVPFVKRPVAALVVGLLIIISYILGYFRLDLLWTFVLEYFAFPRHTVDVVSFTPWFGVVLIGIFLMSKELFALRIEEGKIGKKVAFLGQHSLLIYLIHQPLLFGAFNLIEILG